jgi:hypothetical protein
MEAQAGSECVIKPARRDGDFAAMKEPELLAEDIRIWFRAFRSGQLPMLSNSLLRKACFYHGTL